MITLPSQTDMQEAGGLRSWMYNQQGGHCWYCDRLMVNDGSPEDDSFATEEHITPRCKRGGKRIGPARLISTHELERYAFNESPGNKVLVCHWCNAHRGTRPLDEWISTLRSLGLTQGIVSRIQSLIDDWMPSQDKSEAFAAWMQAAEVHTPAENIQALPGAISAILEPISVRRFKS